MFNNSHKFIEFLIDKNVLLFGEFKTKAGRLSPYFFDFGSLSRGVDLLALGKYYAEKIISTNLKFDTVFGPAYKGIPIAVSTAMALAEKDLDVTFSFNRKEAKEHGEMGNIIGSPLSGRILILDDVISAGTSINQSVELIKSSGGKLSGVCIALDRMERGEAELSATEEIRLKYGADVFSIANLDQVENFLSSRNEYEARLSSIRSYRSKYS